MKKYLFIVLCAIAFTCAHATQANAQIYYNYPYYPYYSYWFPFDYYSYGPITVYDPVRARQLEAVDSLKKLNKASDRLLAATSEPSARGSKEIADRADDIAKYAKRLRSAINEGDADKVAPAHLAVDPSNTAAEIDRLVEEVNRTDIDIGNSVNMARRQQTLALLSQIEADARALKAMYKHGD